MSKEAVVLTQAPRGAWEMIAQDVRDRAAQERRLGLGLPSAERDTLRDSYQLALDQAFALGSLLRGRAEQPITQVFLDVDGVLADFTGSALRAWDRDPAAFEIDRWEFWEQLGVSEADFWAVCRGHVFWRNLNPTADGPAILGLVRRLLPAPLWLLTSPSDDPGCYSGKYEWVCEHHPTLKRRLHLAPDKRSVARPGALLIDDNDQNVEAWCAAGGLAVLVPRPWNRRRDVAAAGQTVTYLLEAFSLLKERCRT